MRNTFQGKNGKTYDVTDLLVNNIVKNNYLMLNYSMQELDKLYTEYFGSYVWEYKYILLEKIKHYDCSDNVNSFIFRGKSYWLDKATRVGLMHLADCSNDTLQVVLGDEVLTFQVEFIKDFLAKLEIYASQCYVQTQKHLIQVKNLSKIEDILNYDYTSGYPEKIVLE